MAHKNKQKINQSKKNAAPAWMVTYGDLMSLLLTFFVLIVSFSSIQMTKFQRAMGSLRGALGILPKEQSVLWQMDPLLPQLSDFQKKRIQKVIAELKHMIKEKAMRENMNFEATNQGILIRIESPILYDLGKAELKPQAYPILKKVIDMTQDWSNQIRIEGHTDNIPINSSKYPSNWELSTARALSVLRFFLHQGNIEPERLAAVGYGEYHPLVPNDTPKNRTKNRRVEIYIDKETTIENFKDSIFDYTF